MAISNLIPSKSLKAPCHGFFRLRVCSSLSQIPFEPVENHCARGFTWAVNSNARLKRIHLKPFKNNVVYIQTSLQRDYLNRNTTVRG